MATNEHFRAVFVHGIGTQASDFADESRRWLRAELKARGLGAEFASVHWSDLADGPERAFFHAVTQKGSSGGSMQKLSVYTLCDALFYQQSSNLRKKIYDRLDHAFLSVGPYRPVTVFAHSLGGLIVTDYLRSRPDVDARLVTMGCNLGLFMLGVRWVCPDTLRKPESWLNLFHRRDALGFPLSGHAPTKHVRDVQVSLGCLFRGWTGLSHLLYWGDKALWTKTIPKELDLPPNLK